MGKQFLKNGQVSLVNGGYLTSNDGKSVGHTEFVAAQKSAEYVITFAELAKGKDFVGKKADSLEDLKSQVASALATKERTFVTKPTEVTKPLTKQLADEAMAFMNFQKEGSKVDKINGFLQQFNVLAEFEEHGLFWDEQIVKLNKIYTLQEVVDATTSVIDLLK